MRIIRPMVIVEDDLSMKLDNGLTMAEHMLKKTELYTRTCYKSEGKATENSYNTFVKRIFQTNHHTGIAEHNKVTVRFITDRGVSHEHVRHRMAAYLQESTRYCDYSGKGNTYILPPWVNHDTANTEWCEFKNDLRLDDERYKKYRGMGWTPEKARYFLPTGIKTEYLASMNFGSWCNFMGKRLPQTAHPQIRQITIPLLRYFQTHLPQFFDSFEMPENENGKFRHKQEWYEEAELVVNPYYDSVEFNEVYSEYFPEDK